MMVKTEYAEISVAGPRLRTFLAAPNAEGEYPGIWCYSDIFQLSLPLLRTCVRLAGYGFVVAAPEIYRRIEPPHPRPARRCANSRGGFRWPIAAPVWTGFPSILKSRVEKSVRLVSALEGT
jgi:dienelactone hydrolase